MRLLIDQAIKMGGVVYGRLLLSLHILKGDVVMMAMFFAQRVILEKTTFEDVPNALKAGVAEILIESGLADLVPEEYK